MFPGRGRTQRLAGEVVDRRDGRGSEQACHLLLLGGHHELRGLFGVRRPIHQDIQDDVGVEENIHLCLRFRCFR